ncbi:hypothetical protein [Nocardioides sp. TF02-7]|uniref:hypothetical protein n=1 Tax=Nocardioides sp. TF02-7 TaxID=2917724 RepID=UPI001F052518|nr:hypothetical protein [Nocardioides sp. TF02-7]UMG92913.1 hypothetical protein MF408_00585 [Nocardioides sp. TF02-7]
MLGRPLEEPAVELVGRGGVGAQRHPVAGSGRAGARPQLDVVEPDRHLDPPAVAAAALRRAEALEPAGEREQPLVGGARR